VVSSQRFLFSCIAAQAVDATKKGRVMTKSSLRTAIFACLYCIGTPLRADDNLFGLPAPDDQQRPGAIVLHGGGRITEDVFDEFVSLAGGKNAKIVLVPSAGYRVADYNSEMEFLRVVMRRYSSWVQLQQTGRIKQFLFLYTDKPEDADNEAFVKYLQDATGVWFSGGAQSRLNYRFVGEFPEQTLFQDALRNVLRRGGVVGGTSAGTAAIPEIMTLWEDRDSSSSPATAVAAHGLGLINKAIVEQHFDARGGRLERFTRLLKDHTQLDELSGRARAGERMIGIGVEEQAALVIRGNQVKVMGNSSVHLFLKSNAGRTITWHEMAPGDAAQLVQDIPETTTLAREEVQLRR
jgi:cyanophycinase